MDYRSSITEDEQAAEHSPWGSSPPASPQRNQTTYSSLGNEATYGYGAQDASSGSTHDGLTANEFKRPETSSSNASEHGFANSQPSEESQQSGFEPSLDRSQQQHDQPAQSYASQEQDSTQQHAQGQGQPAPQGQQPRRPTQPQYKLQAKITGLERTGRKDPILRFDVHVGPDECCVQNALLITCL